MSGAFDPLTMLGRGGFDTHATLDLRGPIAVGATLET